MLLFPIPAGLVCMRLIPCFCFPQMTPHPSQCSTTACLPALPHHALPLQLVAGEQIDHLFGARLGLSMMASAGLGNLVADVVGVSATHTVQENIKRIPFARPPRLRCACMHACMHVARVCRRLAAAEPAGCRCPAGVVHAETEAQRAARLTMH
jgi:hypothetical protein